MKILLKILVAPFALALSLLAALLVFLFDICAVLLTIASVILTVLGVALFFTPTPIGGIVFLFLAFLPVFVKVMVCAVLISQSADIVGQRIYPHVDHVLGVEGPSQKDNREKN